MLQDFISLNFRAKVVILMVTNIWIIYLTRILIKALKSKCQENLRFWPLCFSRWKADVSLSWKSLYKSFPPRGTLYENMAKLIKHKAFPFIWKRPGSMEGKLWRTDIHKSHWRTSSRLHRRGSEIIWRWKIVMRIPLFFGRDLDSLSLFAFQWDSFHGKVTFPYHISPRIPTF